MGIARRYGSGVLALSIGSSVRSLPSANRTECHGQLPLVPLPARPLVPSLLVSVGVVHAWVGQIVTIVFRVGFLSLRARGSHGHGASLAATVGACLWSAARRSVPKLEQDTKRVRFYLRDNKSAWASAQNYELRGLADFVSLWVRDFVSLSLRGSPNI